MRKIFLLSFVLGIFFITGCKTIDEKTQAIIKKENEKLSKFIGKSQNELKTVMGIPDFEIKDDRGMIFLTYKSKKYAIVCERRFEIDKSGTVIGFSSKGCL